MRFITVKYPQLTKVLLDQAKDRAESRRRRLSLPWSTHNGLYLSVDFCTRDLPWSWVLLGPPLKAKIGLIREMSASLGIQRLLPVIYQLLRPTESAQVTSSCVKSRLLEQGYWKLWNWMAVVQTFFAKDEYMKIHLLYCKFLQRKNKSSSKYFFHSIWRIK